MITLTVKNWNDYAWETDYKVNMGEEFGEETEWFPQSVVFFPSLFFL